MTADGGTAAEELARLLVGTRSRREAQHDAIVRLAEQVTPAEFSLVARGQRLERLLLERLRLAAPELAGPYASHVADPHEQALWAWTLRATGDRVTDALERRGIPALPLKGVELAARLYGDELMRVSTDVDILVRRTDMAAAAETIAQLGYDLVEGRLDRLPRLHLTFYNDSRMQSPIELHWRIHWYEDAFADAMVERSALVAGRRVPDAADDLASLLLFYHRDGFSGLRLAADIAASWDARGHEIEDGAIGRLARQHPALRRALTASLAVSERIVGVPAERLLGDLPRLDRRLQIATELDNWTLRGDIDQIRAEVMLVDGLSSPAGRLGYFVRRAVMLTEPQFVRPPRTGVVVHLRRAGSRASHPFKLLARFVIALRPHLLAARRPR